MKLWIPEFYKEYRFQLWIIGIISVKQLEKPIYDKNKKIEQIIASDPKYAYHYARNIIVGPWPLGENAIASHPLYAYYYARNIIVGPWPLGENAIASDPLSAYYYARNIIVGPWPPGEKAITSKPEYAYWYAKWVRTLAARRKSYRFRSEMCLLVCQTGNQRPLATWRKSHRVRSKLEKTI